MKEGERVCVSVVVQVGAAAQGVFLWHRLRRGVQLVSRQADLVGLLFNQS